MFNKEEFHDINEDNNIFVKIDDDKVIEEEEKNFADAFISGLPEWDLEPLYESIKRGGNK